MMTDWISQELWAGAIARAVEVRRKLHRIPELAYQEHQTAAAIRAELDRLGLKYVAGVAGAQTATIATIGDPSKPCVALRADIDALPLVEQTRAPHASTHEGFAHACGHDGHAAMLLAAAELLQSGAAEGAGAGKLDVCVKCIWQPAEEGGGGAERLVAAGVLDGRLGPKVSAIFALHGWPNLPVGAVGSRVGAMMAATDNFAVTMTGRGGHAASPHLGRDPVVAVAEAILSLQQISSREIDPLTGVIVTVGMVHGGTAVNVIPASVCFEGTVRTLSDDVRAQVRQAMQRRVSGVAEACGCAGQLDWTEGYPCTVNDPGAADYVQRVAREALGQDAYIPLGAPSMGGEDFAYYLQQVPGCFIRLGLRPHDLSDTPGLHSPQFDFNDDAIATGVRLLVNLAGRWKGL